MMIFYASTTAVLINLPEYYGNIKLLFNTAGNLKQ